MCNLYFFPNDFIDKVLTPWTLRMLVRTILEGSTVVMKVVGHQMWRDFSCFSCCKHFLYLPSRERENMFFIVFQKTSKHMFPFSLAAAAAFDFCRLWIPILRSSCGRRSQLHHAVSERCLDLEKLKIFNVPSILSIHKRWVLIKMQKTNIMTRWIKLATVFRDIIMGFWFKEYGSATKSWSCRGDTRLSCLGVAARHHSGFSDDFSLALGWGAQITRRNSVEIGNFLNSEALQSGSLKTAKAFGFSSLHFWKIRL